MLTTTYTFVSNNGTIAIPKTTPSQATQPAALH